MRNLIFLILVPVFVFCGAAEKLPLPSGKAELKQTESFAPVKHFIPKIEKQSIISGGKTLEINPNGQLILNANGENLARFFYFFSGKNRHTGQGQWIESGSANVYPALKSVLRREKNTFLYEGVMNLGGHEWKQYRQELTLLPDGLIRIDCEWFPSPDPENELRGHSFWITIPRSGMNGNTFDLSGRSVTVTPDMNNLILGSLRESSSVLTVFQNNAEKEFRISGERKKEFNGFSVFCFKGHVRISVLEIPKTRKLRFYLDLRRGVGKKSLRIFLQESISNGLKIWKCPIALPGISSGIRRSNRAFMNIFSFSMDMIPSLTNGIVHRLKSTRRKSLRGKNP